MKYALRFPPSWVHVPVSKAHRQMKQSPSDSVQYTAGWWTLILLVVVLASTLCSIAIAWQMPIEQLMIPAALNLLLGIATAKQRRLSPLYCHVLALVMNLLVACWQIWKVCIPGQPLELFSHSYPMLLLTGGAGDDVIAPYCAVTMFGCMLAYVSTWCVIRARWLWPLLLVHTLILMSMLAASDYENLYVFAAFVLAALLLILQVHLHMSTQQWDQSGVQYPVQLKRQMVLAGRALSIGILLLAWFLPSGYVNTTALHLWSHLFSNQEASSTLTYPFRQGLALAIPPELSPRVVATVRSPTQGVYLESRWYDIYTGRGWTNGATIPYQNLAQQPLPSGALLTYPLQQTITLATPLGGSGFYLLGAPGKTRISLPATILMSPSDGEPVAWFAQSRPLPAGTQYTVTSSISFADAQMLRTVPMPAEQLARASPAALSTLNGEWSQVTHFLQLPSGLDPRIAHLAQQITAGATTMYDKVVALESYLHTHYTYTTQVELPPGAEGVSWFLFDSGYHGYCTYFATAMTILARSIGIPARLVTGYAPGTYDPEQHQQVIRGTDAHSWTQVYFVGYGWINFEPTPGFSTLSSTLANSGVSYGVDITGVLHRIMGTMIEGMVILLLILCLCYFLWWQRQWPGTSRATHLYGRICLLAIYVGLGPAPWQTPGEYIQELTLIMPGATVLLERLCDLYIREQWTHSASAEHPQHTGELQELPDLWKQLRPHLFWGLLRYHLGLSKWHE